MINNDDYIACVSETLGECFGEDKIMFVGRNADINISVILNPSLTTNKHYMKIFNNSFIPYSDKCCRISLTGPEYIHIDESNMKEEFRLNKKQKEFLIQQLRQPFVSKGCLMYTPIKNQWEYLIYIYNSIRMSNDKSLQLLGMDSQMPNYTLLPE